MADKRFDLSIVVDAITKSASQNLEGFGKVLGGIATAGAVVGTALVAGAAVAGGALIKLAVDAAPLEGIEKAFEGIATASGESADTMLAALQKGSAGMITQRDLMAKYNLAASLVSDTFANQLPNAMGYLSKVAGATGEDMGFMLDSLVRGVGRLSPMILDNLGIQVSLQEAYEAFAPTIGKTASELSKQEQQTALMNQVMEKLAANTAAMPEVTGTAAHALGVMGTQIKDLKDGIGLALQPVLVALLTPLNELAQTYGPQVIEWAKAAGTWLGENIPKAITWLRSTWEEVWPVVSAALTSAWKMISPIFQALKDWLSGEGTDAMGGFSATWNVLSATVLAVVDVFKNQVLPPLQEAFNSITEALAIMGVDWGDVWEAVGQAVKIVAIVIGTVVVGIIGILVGLATAFAKMYAHVYDTLAAMAATFQLVFDSIQKIIGGALAIIKGIFTGDMELIKAGWNTWLEGMSGAVRGIFEGIRNFINLTLGTVWTIISGFCEGVFGFFKNLYDRLVGGSLIQDLMNRLRSIFFDGLQNVISIILGWRDRLVDAFNGIRNVLEGLWDKVVRVRDVFYSTVGAFNEVRHWISVIIEKFNHLKSCLANFQLPWWLSPGSPTPLEMGLVGIEKVLADVQGLAKKGIDFDGGITLAGVGGGIGGGGTTTVNIINRFGPGSVRSDQDILDIADATTKSFELRGIRRIL